MNALPQPVADEPTGVQTNGVGNTCTAHLNLTRTIADVQRDRVFHRLLSERLPTATTKKVAVTPPRAVRPPFAGYDPTEKL